MGFKYHIVYLNENGRHDYKDISAGDIEEAIRLLKRRVEVATILLICVLN